MCLQRVPGKHRIGSRLLVAVAVRVGVGHRYYSGRKCIMEQGPASLLNDRPSDEDYLGFTPYRRALSGLITDPHTDNTPLTIGVFGPWGSGKTTLLQMVKGDVENRPVQVTDKGVLGKHVTVWFTAWKYEKQDALWRALLLRGARAQRDPSLFQSGSQRDDAGGGAGLARGHPARIGRCTRWGISDGYQ